MSNKIVINKDEEAAMRINALINNSEVPDIIIEDEEEEIVEKPKRVRKGRKKKQEENKKVEMLKIETLDHFKRLKENTEFNIFFKEHDIHYKDQFWPIPERIVKYNLELVKIPMCARSIADLMCEGSEIEKDKAYRGDVRYYKVVTYENVVNTAKEVAYARVEYIENEKKFKLNTKVLTEALKLSYADPDKVENNIMAILKATVR